jgi:hypothetical protein
MFQRPGRTTWLLLALCLAGCRSDPRAGISGQVLVDGQPLEVGSILFQPTEGTQSPNAGSSIVDGEYEVPRPKGPMAGKYRVEIHAFRKTGRKIAISNGALIDEEKEWIPARYNSQTTLLKTVQAGDNVLNFELTSK